MGGPKRWRNSIRFPLQARVAFQCRDREGNQGEAEGTSRDISEKGAFVLTVDSPPVGANVELRLLLPRLDEARAATRIDIQGTVLRVEEVHAGRYKSGFAVLTTEATLRENDVDPGEGNSGEHDSR